MNTERKKISNPLDEQSVSMTLFIGLYPKAIETGKKNPIVVDRKAVEIVEQVGVDYRSYFQKRAYHPAIFRTYIIDKGVKDFLAVNPECIIINLGCGLDTRMSRIDNGTLRWFDVDLPDVIEFRKKFFTESERVRFIPKSVLDFTWMDDIQGQDTDKVLIIAEGLFLYFSEPEVREIFARVIDRFPKAEMYMTLVHKFLIGKHMSSGVTVKWGLENAEEICAIHPRIKLRSYWRASDFFKNRQNIFLRLFYTISSKGKNMNRTLHLSFDNNINLLLNAPSP